jgi:hypothetical protein
MSEKKVVHYREVYRIAVGERALVTPIDHTSPLVYNEEVAITTAVESYDPTTGVFETKNTIYKPNLILG